MRGEDKKGGKKWLVLLLLLLPLFILYYLIRPYLSKITSDKKVPVGVLPTKAPVADDEPSEPEKVTKCQSVVVTPKTTTELFTYVSGDKVRADYRIGATTEEDSFKTQILYDGERVFMWKPPTYYGGPKPENPRGIKMKTADFKYNVKLTEIGVVDRFGASPLSGDHLCSEWDGVDPVFDVPSDFEFDETGEFGTNMNAELKRICQPCEGAGTDELKSECRKNLACE